MSYSSLHLYLITKYTWLLFNPNPNPWNWASIKPPTRANHQIQTSYPLGKSSREHIIACHPLTEQPSRTRVLVESYSREDPKLRYWVDSLATLAYSRNWGVLMRGNLLRRWGVSLLLEGGSPFVPGVVWFNNTRRWFQYVFANRVYGLLLRFCCGSM